jgi:hypothetical protein
MDIDRIEWLREARRATGYRRMFGLAVLISSNSSSTRAERRSAETVSHLLGEVVGLAVADATDLQRARIAFGHLSEIVTAVECQLERLPLLPDSHPALALSPQNGGANAGHR